jgi:hypothetical protein
MIVGELRYAISLLDGISAPSKQAALNVRKLQGELRTAKLQLSEYQGQLTRAKALGDVEGYRKYSALVADSRRQVFDLSQAVEDSGASMTKAGAAAGSLSFGLGAVAAGAALGAGAIYGVVRATESLLEKALEVTETNRRLSASFEALGGAGAGTKTLAFVDDLAQRLPQSRKEIAGWVSQFQALGITDLGQIREQVLATASAQAITFAQGGQGAEVYTKLAERIHVAVEEHKGLKLADRQLKQLYEAGLNVTEVAAAYGRETRQAGFSVEKLAAELKGGTINAQAFGNALSATLVQKGQGPLRAMGDEFGTLKLKAAESLAHLFDDVDTTPLTDGIRSWLDLLGQGTASGKSLKAGMTDAINAIIKGVARTGWEAEIFFGRLEIWALQAGVTLAGVERVVGRIAAGFGSVISSTTAIAGAAVDVSGLPSLARNVATLAAPSAPASPAKAHADGGIVTGTTASAPLATTVSIAGLGPRRAPANAEGGIVTSPASGEAFASVAPGEMIVPQRIVRQIQSDSRGPSASPAPQETHFHIDRLELSIDAPAGVTDATAVSASGIAVALERLQLSSGR